MVLERAFQFLDQHLYPSVKTTLFGSTSTSTSTSDDDDDDDDDDDNLPNEDSKVEQEPAKNKDVPSPAPLPPSVTSSVELFRTDQLHYSTREPVVNVHHAPHGHFGIHRDGKALTILMSLSDPFRDEDDDEEILGQENHHQHVLHEMLVKVILWGRNRFLASGCATRRRTR